MEMRGKCGFSRNCLCRSSGEMRSGQMPGKFCWKKGRRSVSGDAEREEKYDEGAKSVQVKDLSSEGMAMNMKEPPGQMWR